jgi:hypothetical protein
MQRPRRQRGAAALLLLTVVVLGIAWFAVGALGKAPIATAEREVVTGKALKAGKEALLAYVAQYAARSDSAEPGQLPCPESLTLANPGEASTSCSATALVVGRLPWKTLGIDALRDGQGEPLWYMMRGFRNAPINFGTPGQLTETGAAVVAMIIAPGAPLNTSGDAGTPPAGCSKLNQQVATRNSASLVATNFLECGSASGAITSPGDSRWTNDRVIAITQAEWADAIAGAVADRLQRQVAPAMNDFRTTTSAASWGESFLPNASTISSTEANSQPESNNLCGNNNMRIGMAPTATFASGTCDTNWNGGNLGGLGALLALGTCWATAADVRCSFTMILPGVATPWLELSAPNIGYSFRAFDPADIRIQVNGGASQSVTVTNYSAFGVADANGSATIRFTMQFPALTIAASVVVIVPFASDALLADARSAWFVNNGWDRFTYYGVSQAATHDPGTTVCNPGGTLTNCLTVNNMPAPTNDKRLVLVLTGRQRAGTTQPSYTLSNYWEGQNASVDAVYEVASVDASFNDRVAACPFIYTNESGTPIQPC